jgi:hypothetical protein
MYFSVPSNLMERPDHLTCRLMTCPVFHATLSSPFAFVVKDYSFPLFTNPFRDKN